LAESYDLSDADRERSEEIAELFADIATELIDEGEEVDDVVYAMVLTISYIMAMKQAADALMN
jgi:hypothetical protein